MSVESKQMESDGDVELWIVHGVTLEGGVWKIPVYAQPFKDDAGAKLFRLDSAVWLGVYQAEALAGRLIHLSRSVKGGQAILTSSDFEGIAEKAGGITPKFYYRWPGHTPDQPVETGSYNPDQDYSGETESFITEVWRRTQLVPLGTFKLCWKAACQEALLWMVEKQKPVDLGFVRLVPVPYRCNWKSILSVMFPQAGRALRSPQLQANEMLQKMGFMGNLANGILAAINRKVPHVRWRIEAVHRASWWKASDDYNARKYTAIGPARYCRFWTDAIKKLKDEILEAFSDYSNQASIPCAQVEPGRVYGSPVLHPWVPDGCVNPKSAVVTRMCVVDDDDGEIKPIAPEHWIGKTGKVPHLLEMPGVPPQAPDVRPSNRAGVGRRAIDRKLSDTARKILGDSDGLPLLDSNEDKAEGQRLLAAQNDGGGAWVV